MTGRNQRKAAPLALMELIRADIAYFRQCIHDAGPLESHDGHAALAAYAPFLRRRLRLLAQLEHAHALRV